MQYSGKHSGIQDMRNCYPTVHRSQGLGTRLSVFPQILELTVAHKLPKSRVLHKILPKGALKMVVMVIVGSFFANWISPLQIAVKRFDFHI